jgi:hypothetical protein
MVDATGRPAVIIDNGTGYTKVRAVLRRHARRVAALPLRLLRRRSAPDLQVPFP